jgi:hypothetical protein
MRLLGASRRDLIIEEFSKFSQQVTGNSTLRD